MTMVTLCPQQGLSTSHHARFPNESLGYSVEKRFVFVAALISVQTVNACRIIRHDILHVQRTYVDRYAI